MASSSPLLRLAPQDNIVVALRAIGTGEQITLDEGVCRVDRDIAVGHKLAARAIAAGETIVKYNCPIGVATRAIPAGAYVHTHNVASSYLPTYTLPT
jgi:altronate dehydratase small subunit